MAGVTLPKDIVMRQEASPRTPYDPYIESADLDTSVLDEKIRTLGKLTTWASAISEAADRHNIPTDIDVVSYDSREASKSNPRYTLLHTGWKVIVDTAIGGGGDSSNRPTVSVPTLSTQGVMLTRQPGRQLLAFKSVGGETVHRVDIGRTNIDFADGFGISNIALIDKNTYPLPRFLDTWSDEMGLNVIRDCLLSFVDHHQLDT